MFFRLARMSVSIGENKERNKWIREVLIMIKEFITLLDLDRIKVMSRMDPKNQYKTTKLNKE